MTQNPDLFHEKELWQAFPLIAGLDEAGRGALAGPVCVGTVILPRKHPHLLRALSRARDSKQLTPRQRTDLVPLIQQIALAHGIGFAPSEEIDRLGIVPATRLAASRALESIHILPDYLLTDFRLELPELDIPQTAIVKGDARSLSIACASILAKTARDAGMRALDAEYPQYGFARHMGYPTAAHCRALQDYGPTQAHRKSFGPVAQLTLL